MYKVFINNHPLILADPSVQEQFGHGTVFIRYDSDETFDTLLRLAHEHDSFFSTIYLIGSDAESLFGLLRSRCKFIEAAGGRVRNASGQTLLIFRNGKWDLPKGKIDKGESPEEAALREVEEECGIGGLTIVRPLEPTFHTYIYNEKLVLKKTYWYEMRCTDKRPLVPQTEEGITEVIWADAEKVKEAMRNTYRSIGEVMEQA